MRDVLVRIKRAVLAGNYAFSEKARIEMEVVELLNLTWPNPFSMQWQFTNGFDLEAHSPAFEKSMEPV